MRTATGRRPRLSTVAGRAAAPVAASGPLAEPSASPDQQRACRVCGCSEATACRLPDRACRWVPDEQDLCDAPSCLYVAATAQRDRFRSLIAIAFGHARSGVRKPSLQELRVAYNRLEALLRLLYQRSHDLRGLI